MKRIALGALLSFAFLVTMGLLRGPSPARAQAVTSGGKVIVGPGPVEDHAYFAALYQNGKLVRSGGSSGNNSVLWNRVPTGTYELHIEAKGYVTAVMPVHVVAGQDNQYVDPQNKGEGVLYFGKTPSLKDLLDRISRLEAAVKKHK